MTLTAAQEACTWWLVQNGITETTIFNPSAKGFYKKEFGFVRRALKRRVRQKLLTRLT